MSAVGYDDRLLKTLMLVLLETVEDQQLSGQPAQNIDNILV